MWSFKNTPWVVFKISWYRDYWITDVLTYWLTYWQWENHRTSFRLKAGVQQLVKASGIQKGVESRGAEIIKFLFLGSYTPTNNYRYKWIWIWPNKDHWRFGLRIWSHVNKMVAFFSAVKVGWMIARSMKLLVPTNRVSPFIIEIYIIYI